MPVAVLQGAFTAGELAPSLTARVDLEKYSKGCRRLKNFLVQAHGGAVKRPGFLLLDELEGEAALIPFIFNQSQAYCLVFGEKRLRIARPEGLILNDAGAVYEIESPYTLAQARDLSWCQSADILFLAVHGVCPHKLKRLGHNHWQFEALSFAPPLAAPEWESLSFSNGARKSDGSISPAQLISPYSYFVTAVDSDGRESNLSAEARITGPASNNWQAGDYIRLCWKAVEGADSYRIYKASYGGRPGYLAECKDLSWDDNNVSPSLTEGAPEYYDPFPDGDYPGAVCIFEQRLVLASTPRRPQTIWLSKSGDYGNFARYRPQADDCPIELTIASSEVSGVNWLASLRTLILGMADMEWEISGRGENAFSAKNAKVTPQSYWGSSLRRAMIVGNVILHVTASGQSLRSLQYEFAADSYGGMDLSIMAAHLFQGHRIVNWTYQKSPDSIIWAVRDDGLLLGLTFQAEHQISAWHRHETRGRFKAVCAIPGEKGEGRLFCLIERNGRHYLEVSAPRYLGGDPREAVFVDSALSYTGAPVQRLSGLGHLEGEEVQILADGAVHPPRLVRAGAVELERPASTLILGLGYAAELETMPVEIMGQNGASVGAKKQIHAVDLLLQDSLGLKVGLCFEDARMQEVKWREREPYGQPPAPYSGLKSLVLPALAENSQTICLRSALPTPVTVLALVSRMELRQ